MDVYVYVYDNNTHRVSLVWTLRYRNKKETIKYAVAIFVSLKCSFVIIINSTYIQSCEQLLTLKYTARVHYNALSRVNIKFTYT